MCDKEYLSSSQEIEGNLFHFIVHRQTIYLTILFFPILFCVVYNSYKQNGVTTCKEW